MSNVNAIEVLKDCQAFLEGHFLLSSGRHSSAYCQMAYLQQYPDKCAQVMSLVAEQLKEMDIDVIVGPATKRVIEEAGGVCLGITCVVDRTKPEAPSPIPILASAVKLDLPNYLPEECPICAEGKLPLVHLGSRKMKEKAVQSING